MGKQFGKNAVLGRAEDGAEPHAGEHGECPIAAGRMRKQGEGSAAMRRVSTAFIVMMTVRLLSRSAKTRR